MKEKIGALLIRAGLWMMKEEIRRSEAEWRYQKPNRTYVPQSGFVKAGYAEQFTDSDEIVQL